jgi:formylglycine-generating enzyme required for sulfatase activity
MATIPPAEPNVDELAQRLQAALGDSYAVEKPLGAGGFAVVYLVRDLSLKRNLAVKVLSPDLITSKTVLERFKREAETVAGLSHPNIVPLHFIGEKQDLLYLAMACIDGGSVADRLDKQGPLPIADVERIISEVASALAHAHKRGVIHRDIKPQNVLTDSESGRSLVTDFGIARTADSSLTATGMFIGTPAYLAPEQVTGEPSDHRADIYALGVMAYELLAGQAPFLGATPTAVLMKRLAGPPEPIMSVRKDTPPELAAVVDTCMASDPEQRFQSASDIVAALHGDVIRTPTSPGGRTVKRPPARKPWVVPLAVGLGVTVVAAVVVAVVIRKSTLDPSRTSAPPVTTTAVEMIAIPAGTYTIGERGIGPASPPYQVTMPGFSMEKTEVTVAAYKEYVAATNGVAPWGDSLPSPSLPVTRVTWPEANTYCKWRHPDGGRLPTEEEWEAAARGPSLHSYPWGDTFAPGAANTESAGQGAPVPVGSYPRGATPLGLQDMIGNVWEWTSSSMRPYKNGGPMPPEMTTNMRVIRGGAFNTLDRLATVSIRGRSQPTTKREDLAATGLRCVK